MKKKTEDILDKSGLFSLIITVIQGLMVFGLLFWWGGWYKKMLIEELLK